MEGQEARAPGGQDRHGPESVAQETRVFMVPGLLQAHGSAQTHPAPLLLSAAESSPHCSHCELTEQIPGADGPDTAEACSHLFCRFLPSTSLDEPSPKPGDQTHPVLRLVDSASASLMLVVFLSQRSVGTVTHKGHRGLEPSLDVMPAVHP